MRDYQVRFVDQELMPLALDGKRLLEIGAGGGEVCRLLLERKPSIERIIGINHRHVVPEGDPGCDLVVMDACELGFADESFDLVYSLATFEHIHDLPGALAQMRRVLVPGGLVVSVWSPIWNGFNGHHYGSMLGHPDDSDINLPWAHHILGPTRMREYLVAGESFSPQEADRAVGEIYESPSLNRLCYGDYRRILAASGLEPVAIEGVRVDFAGLLHRVEEQIAAGHVQPEELIAFFKRVPEEEILTYKIRVVLRRPHSA